jgi:O-antigen ligase
MWFLVLPFLPDNIIDRMTIQSVVETGGTGRWDIWKLMLNEVKSSQNKLILGRGFGDMNRIFLEGRWDPAVAHNQLIQVLYNQGIVGLTAFLCLTMGCFFRCVRKRRTVSVAIIGMMALSVSLSFNQTTRTFWNLVAYAAFNFTEGETNRLPEVDQP